MGKVDEEWCDLTEEQKAAAGTLGYDEATWDGNGVVGVDEKEWEELTAEEKAAAEILGYTEEEWDEDGVYFVCVCNM